jgi:hypothetical protein
LVLAGFGTVDVADTFGLQLYVAPAGEPALGPTAFPHRISAMSDPLGPIGHHWEDSTHISFGVVTAGIFTRMFKLEGSWFNGREPDETRWDLDLRVPDSYSARLTFNPDTAWSTQVSWGWLASPETLEPDVSLHRVTASATWNAKDVVGENLATTAAVGVNAESNGETTPAALLESAWNIDGHHQVFGRVEAVAKSGDDLVLGAKVGDDIFPVGSVDAGYIYSFGPFGAVQPGIGVRGSLGIIDDAVGAAYGTQLPVGGMVFIQLRPAPMQM